MHPEDNYFDAMLGDYLDGDHREEVERNEEDERAWQHDMRKHDRD